MTLGLLLPCIHSFSIFRFLATSKCHAGAVYSQFSKPFTIYTLMLTLNHLMTIVNYNITKRSVDFIIK